MIKILCDRCGADITNRDAFGEITVKLHEYPDFDTPFKWISGEGEDEHYCRECAEEIARFIHTPPEKGVAAQEEPAEPPRTALQRQRRKSGGK